MYVTDTIVTGRWVCRDFLFIHDAPDGRLELRMATTHRVKRGRISICVVLRTIVKTTPIFLTKILSWRPLCHCRAFVQVPIGLAVHSETPISSCNSITKKKETPSSSCFRRSTRGATLRVIARKLLTCVFSLAASGNPILLVPL